MSLKRCSYLTGLTFANHYARVGAFRGSLPAGFMVSALLRFKAPFQGDTTLPRVELPVASNFAPTPPFPAALGAGWQLLWSSPDVDNAQLRPRYATVGGAIVDAFPGAPPGAQLLKNATLSCDTMLLHWFMGVTAFGSPSSTLLYVNGNLIAVAPVAGYVAPDATNPFRVGAGILETDGSELNGGSMGLSGFAYYDTVSQDEVVIQDQVKAHWDAVQEAEDMVLCPQLPADTALFSVRRTLRTVTDGASDPWVASNGSVSQLDRIGTASLKTFASRPHFFDEPWSFGNEE